MHNGREHSYISILLLFYMSETEECLSRSHVSNSFSSTLSEWIFLEVGMMIMPLEITLKYLQLVLSTIEIWQLYNLLSNTSTTLIWYNFIYIKAVLTNLWPVRLLSMAWVLYSQTKILRHNISKCLDVEKLVTKLLPVYLLRFFHP
jgi:hypothetical protein